MSTSNALVIRQSSPTLVDNVIVVDAASPIVIPGAQVILYSGPAGPGWSWDGTTATSPVRPPPVPATISTANKAVQSALDAVAKSWGYDSLVSAVSYVGDPCVQYAAEGAALRDWRSLVWTTMSPIIAVVPLVETVAQIVAQMPAAPTRPVV